MQGMLDTAISFWNTAGAAFWGYASAMLIQTAALVAVLLLLDFLLLRRHVRAVVRYWVWLLVLVKVMLPPTVSLPTSIGYWVAGTWHSSVAPADPPAPAAVAEIKPVQAALAPAVSPPAADPMPRETAVSPDDYGGSEVFDSPVTLPELRPTRHATASVVHWQAWLASVWLAGVIVFAGLMIQRVIAVHRLVGRSVRPEDRVAAALEEYRREMGIRRPVRLAMTAELSSPAVCGIVRPWVLLPPSVVACLDASQLRAILIHELAHIARGDSAVQALQTVLQVLHFYNPFVWLANALIRRVREQAVDENTLVILGREASDYGQALIEVASLALPRRAISLGLAGVVESRSALAARIRHILSGRVPTHSRLGLAGGIAVGILAITIIPMAGGAARPAARASEEPVAVVSVPKTQPSDSVQPAGAAAGSASLPAGSHTLDLQVVRSDTRSPVPQAEVVVRLGRQRERRVTDDQGRLHLDFGVEEPDDLVLTASKEGFAGTRAFWYRRHYALGIPPTFTLPLDAGTSIGGVVQNESGQPIPDVKVHLELDGVNVDKGHAVYSSMADRGIVKTDANGRWRCDVMPPQFDQLTVYLEHPDYISETQVGQRSTPPIAKLRDFSSVMVLKRGLTVSGTVRNQQGEPVANASVSRDPNKRVVSKYQDVRTDAQGRFEFRNVPPGQAVITVEAKGYAPSLAKLDLTMQPASLDLQLEPGHTIRVRVVDPQGKPLEGVWAWSRHWRGFATFMHEAKTDKDGRFAMGSAPRDEVRFEMGKEGYFQIWDQPITAGTEVVLTLKPVLRVRGKVMDADTGRPITRFQMVPGFGRKGAEPYWDRMHAKTMPGSEYECTFNFPRDGYLIRIEAEGYAPAVSPTYSGEEGTVSFDFRLKYGGPQAGIRGTVKDSSGKPVAGAPVALAIGRRPIYVQNGNTADNQHYPSARTDESGSFSISFGEDVTAVVVVADQGFARAPGNRAAGPLDIRLEPWGQIEGVMKIGSRPAADEQAVLLDDRDFQALGVLLDYRSGVDNTGRFVIERVPAGTYRIGREVIFNETGDSSMRGSTSVVPVVVKAGTTTRVTIGGTGRAIMGRVAMPPGTTKPVDFTWGRNELTGPGVQFPIILKSDGAFRVEDIPAGTYKLSIRIQERPKDPYRDFDSAPLATCVQTVNVPDMKGGRSDEPLDLGTLELKELGVPRGSGLGSSPQSPNRPAATGTRTSSEPRVVTPDIQHIKSRLMESQQALHSGMITWTEKTFFGRPAGSGDRAPGWQQRQPIYEFNRRESNSCTITFDLGLNQFKKISKDNRDLRALLGSAGLSGSDTGNLSRDSVQLIGKDYVLAFHPPNRTLILKSFRGPTLVQDGALAGVLSSALLDSAADIDLSDAVWEGFSVTRIVITRKEFQITAYVDASLDLRFRRYESRQNGRLLHQEDLSDYRVINGIPYPFYQKKQTWDPVTGEIQFQAEISVDEARFNVALPPDVFSVQIPGGTLVFEYDTAKQHRTSQDLTVTLENAKTLLTHTNPVGRRP